MTPVQPNLFDAPEVPFPRIQRSSRHPLGMDLAEGVRRKNEGHEKAVSHRVAEVVAAREVARILAHEKGEITFDDVYAKMIELGRDPRLLGASAGALFRCSEFVFTGEWRKSPRTTNHARMNRVWRLS